MTNTYLVHAREFLTTNAEALDRLYERQNVIKWRNFCNDHGLEFNSGETRIAIIGEDFVIKIDKKNIGNWARFGNCYQEYKNWQMVKADGYDYMFAAITKMKGGHHYYYVMPKVNTNHGLGVWAHDLEDLSDEEQEYLLDHFADLHEHNYGFDDYGCLQIFDYAVTYEYMFAHMGKVC